MAILEVKNVNKRFGGLQALGDVNLNVAENSVHAIIGPNGAGKSTLLNVLVGKLIPDTGSVMFDGQSVLGRKPYEINQMGISRVFQTPEISLLCQTRRRIRAKCDQIHGQSGRSDRQSRAHVGRHEPCGQAGHARGLHVAR